jgi:hypothetical protein
MLAKDAKKPFSFGGANKKQQDTLPERKPKAAKPKEAAPAREVMRRQQEEEEDYMGGNFDIEPFSQEDLNFDDYLGQR